MYHGTLQYFVLCHSNRPIDCLRRVSNDFPLFARVPWINTVKFVVDETTQIKKLIKVNIF